MRRHLARGRRCRARRDGARVGHDEAADRAHLGDRRSPRSRPAPCRGSASASCSRAATSTRASWPRRSAWRRRDDRGAARERGAPGRARHHQGPGRRPHALGRRGTAPAPGGSGLRPHRPLARAAHHGRVRRRLRRAGARRAGGDGLRLGARQARLALLRRRARGRRGLAEARLRGDHGRRPRDHGGRQPRRERGRRALDRLQHRAAARAVAESLREPLDRLPLLLRAQDDVRQVLGGVRRLPRRLRHAGRAVRGADADPDRPRSSASRSCSTAREYWSGLLDWIRETLAVEGMVSDDDLALVQVVDTTDEVCAIATGGARR